MLISLSVKNFAIIEDLKIEFKDGMTVLTGETGAGKSLIIDSIGLLLGDRADSDMIRYGTDKAFIEGVFSYKNPHINEILERLGIEIKENITIYREISSSGRNVIKVNDCPITLVELKNIKMYLADIHVQHDTFKLINPDTYLSFIDDSENDKFIKLFNDYQIHLDKYQVELKKYKDLSKKVETSKERLEFLIYERDELEALDLYPNKDQELETEISKLSNFDKIYRALNEAYEALDGEISSVDNIYNSYKLMDGIKDFDKAYEDATNVLYDSYSNLDDVKSNIYRAKESLDYDEDELNRLQDSLKSIEDVKTKYKKNLDELIKELEDIKLEIELNENYDEVVKTYRENVIKAHESLIKKAISLSDYRKIRAKALASSLINECKDLELPDTDFEVVFNNPNLDDPFNSEAFKENGIDEVSFMISLNKGEPKKPLQKVASGGELSRIMLAFKAIFAENAKLSLMVFDEIDTGVSGSAAGEIANKMKKISKFSQVLCITHLPAVAASGDTQLYISKVYEDGRTKTQIKELSLDERVEKIAMMIGGNQISKHFIDAAREMILNKE